MIMMRIKSFKMLDKLVHSLAIIRIVPQDHASNQRDHLINQVQVDPQLIYTDLNKANHIKI